MIEKTEQEARAALAFAESIIDTIRDPFLVLDGDLRVVNASPEFYRTFGVTPDLTEGRVVYDLGNGQWNIPRLRTLLEEILPKDTTFRDFEMTHDFERIGRKVMLLNARQLKRGPGERELILLAIEDVTARRDAEDARRDAETRFTEMVKNVRDHSIFLTDPNGIVTSWNVAAERIIGYPEAEAIGQHFSLIFTPEDVAAGVPAEELRHAREWGRAEDERWHQRKGGQPFWALGIVTPLRDAHGRITGFSKILRDMTERKHAEEALQKSEARSRIVVEAALDYAILTTDAQGTIASWSPGAEAVFGWSPAEAVGRPVDMMFTAEDQAAGAPEQERTTARAKGFAPDVRWHVRKDGARVYIEGVMRALSEGFLKVGQDVTERRRTEESLRESEERLRVALGAGQMGTWLWRIVPDEQVLDESLRGLMGLPPGEEVTTLNGFLRTVHPDDRARVQGEFDRCRQQGGDFNVEFRVTWPDGSVHWLKDQGKKFDTQDRGPFMTGAAMDITDRKRLEDELHEAHRRKDEFLAMLGHELRNPLAPLRSVTETLRCHKLDADGVNRAYDMMERQVGHLTRLVDDLLDVSRITRGLVELRMEAVNLAEIVDEAVEMAVPVMEARRHNLQLSLPRKPLLVKADVTRLTQVVFNLLNNAAKYTNEGGKVWLTIEREGDQAVVCVRDNGLGMKPDLVPKVFDLFTQGDRALDRSQGGLGLGLTLVKRLVEMHDGRVEAKSDGLGKGSEFIVRLPALPAEDSKPAPARVSGPPVAAVQVDRVLIVDDNFDVAESVTWLLQGLAHEIKMVHSGAAALEMVTEFKPNIIVCDIGMPGMDGYETCRRLRQVPGLENALIAAVSGYATDEDQQKSKAAGFDRHLVKPIGRAHAEDLVVSAAKGQEAFN